MSNNRPGHVLKHWAVDVSIDEHDGHTRAKARLRWRDQESVGVGLARRNPADRNVADIGDELAVARALTDLANRLLTVTAHDIEAVTHEAVTPLR
jgi:Rv2632c-like